MSIVLFDRDTAMVGVGMVVCAVAAAVAVVVVVVARCDSSAMMAVWSATLVASSSWRTNSVRR